jgi:hypothetical protein
MTGLETTSNKEIVQNCVAQIFAINEAKPNISNNKKDASKSVVAEIINGKINGKSSHTFKKRVKAL